MKRLYRIYVTLVVLTVTCISSYAEFDYPYGAEDEVWSYSLPRMNLPWDLGFYTYGQYEVDGMYYCILDYGRREAALVANHPICELLVGDEIASGHGNSCRDWEKGTLEGDIVVPNEVMLDGNEYLIIAIGYGAFYGCENLTSIKLPMNIRFISNNAFYGCNSLEEITIWPGCYVAPEAFSMCPALKKLNLKNCYASALNMYGCDALEELKLPEINPEWHYGNSPILLVGCEALRSLYSFSPEAFTAWFVRGVVNGYDFDKQFDNITLYVPIGSYDSYRNHESWGCIKNIVESEVSDVNEIVVPTDDAPIYYNLQGRRVCNPTKGIYIECRGNSVKKILIAH